jgi:hypothetical protein
MTDSEVADRRLYGVQICVFETLWPQKRLSQIYIRDRAIRVDIYFRFAAEPLPEERATCEYLMQEILTLAFPNKARRAGYRFGVAAPSGSYRELMSSTVFERIAKDRAPWRLVAGR